MGLETLIWHRPKEILETAKRRTLTSEELLALKSVGFFLPIRFLRLAKGDSEVDKEIYVKTAYNIFRLLDQLEDVLIKKNGEREQEIKNKRKDMITNFSYIVGEVVKRDYSNARTIEDLINSDYFRSITSWLMANEPNDEGRVFAQHFGRGVVLRDLYKIGEEGETGKMIKEALDYSVKNMAEGMRVFIDQGPIQTLRRLDNYCEYVAGKVGKNFLNKVVMLKDGIQLDSNLAELFAKYLQFTNIIKNVRQDYEEGRKFLPSELITGISYEFMMDQDTLEARQIRNKVLSRLIDYTNGKFLPSVKYIKSIPTELSGYRAFCLFPLIHAQKTLENMQNAGIEQIFHGDPGAIKIIYGIESIKDFCYNIVTKEVGKKLDAWLDEYSDKPQSFSFHPQAYANWSKDWIK